MRLIIVLQLGYSGLRQGIDDKRQRFLIAAASGQHLRGGILDRAGFAAQAAGYLGAQAVIGTGQRFGGGFDQVGGIGNQAVAAAGKQLLIINAMQLYAAIRAQRQQHHAQQCEQHKVKRQPAGVVATLVRAARLLKGQLLGHT